MASSSKARALFEQVDKNRYGRIDENEFLNRASDGQEFASLSERESIGIETNTIDYDEQTAIHTSSAEETNQILEKSGYDIHNDPNLRIIRKTRTASPVTYEQRIFIRYLRPPTPPPLPPLIIREVHPRPKTPPPLILRERPPKLPSHVPTERVSRYSPPSVIAKHFIPLPTKPHYIILEISFPQGFRLDCRTLFRNTSPDTRYNFSKKQNNQLVGRKSILKNGGTVGSKKLTIETLYRF